MNTKRYLRFWATVILVAAITSILTGCDKYYIEQEVDNYGQTLYLETTIRRYEPFGFFDPPIKFWMDEAVTDSVKCLRYNQAKAFIEKIEAVENFKCE